MQVKDQAKETAIINAVSQIIRKNGLANVSISAVAHRAGISKGTVYIYFKNKQDMIKRSYLVNRQHYNDYLVEHTKTDCSVLDQLNSFIDSLYHFGIKYPNELMIIDTILSSPLHSQLFKNGHDPDELLTPWLKIINEGTKQGVFKPLDAYAAHFFIFHAICDYLKDIEYQNYSEERLSFEQVKQVIIDGLLVSSNNFWIH